MRKTFTLAALAAALAAFAVPAVASAASTDAARGAVYTLTNSTAGNGVTAFARGADGSGLVLHGSARSAALQHELTAAAALPDRSGP